MINYDYANIVDMEEVSEQSYDAMEAYMKAQELIDEKMNKAGMMIDAEERKFADTYGIRIIEGQDKISKKQEAAGLVYKYYNPVYLIFFKAYKDEAQNKNDVAAMDKQKDALNVSSTEDLAQLQSGILKEMLRLEQLLS